MITEKKLQYFIEVCKTENISLAARNLFIAQPALSKTIQELEEELHYPLFDRQGKHIILNENGRIFQTWQTTRQMTSISPLVSASVPSCFQIFWVVFTKNARMPTSRFTPAILWTVCRIIWISFWMPIHN